LKLQLLLALNVQNFSMKYVKKLEAEIKRLEAERSTRDAEIKRLEAEKEEAPGWVCPSRM
jgi:hypothetical protein